MNRIERRRARADALKNITAKPTEQGRHEDELLRYLGAVYYEVRHGRAKPEELERIVAEVESHLREQGTAPEVAKRRRARRRWWRPRSGS